ncbi:glutathione S-transferase [Roseovarius sp. TE539]|uniref:glutathione S-transferase family protein n=1 Tax=Roseovarius sp. TE539 TaxID=2249812 RepID=UPI000DE176FA|nr:glutathione S-transferase family protein [Roseovarius sp. TE539]RBI76073.1 glutathione S-transferase [Roseovarius sp. TE539]
MILYYAPNTISVAVAIALDEAGLDHTLARLDFAKDEQRQADYLAVNPKGRVPALETPQGVLTETGAILDYIAALAPEAGLVPGEPFAAARMRAVMYYLASTMHVNHAHLRRGHRWADNQSSWHDMAAKTPRTMTESCRFIEDHALIAPFVMGTTLTLADPYLFVVSTWLEGDGVEIADFPAIAAFRAAMRARPAVERAEARGMI